MAHRPRLEWRVSSRVVAGSLSALLHLGLFLLVYFSGGRQDGVDDDDTPITQVVMLETRNADHRDGVRLPPLQASIPAPDPRASLDPQAVQPPTLSLSDLDPAPDEAAVIETPPIEIAAPPVDPLLATAIELPLPTFVMPQAQVSELIERIERVAAKKLAAAPSATARWTQHGKQYAAEFVLQRAQSGIEPDRVVAEISAEDRGRRVKTQILLKRVSFAEFTKIIDYWDPMVRLHDDEIVGRVHINSRFSLLSDARARPALLGKVSTAAGSYNMESSGRKRESDVFREGIQTRAGRISLSEQAYPFELTPRDADARVHEFKADTRIRFLPNGSYWWEDNKPGTSQYRAEPPGQPVYFIAARGVTLYVQGVVAGKVVVYSPQGIVIEGSLTYANDPREDPDSADYLGLVSDKDIAIAYPRVTGPDDLDIHAALFAKRRFVVMNFQHSGSGTLRIFGSLAAGTMTATEPRYAMRLEHDGRFQHLRPPGFPAMNRFAAEGWDGRWTEVREQTTSGDH
jgi:hypothetical protein